jgi:ATP-dependent Clp protease ATP-binding subunit ClpC
MSHETTVEHVFLALCKMCDLTDEHLSRAAKSARVDPKIVKPEVEDVSQSLKGAGVKLSETRRQIRRLLRKESGIRGRYDGHRSKACKEVCIIAQIQAKTAGHDTVSLIHHLKAILAHDSPLIRSALGETEGRWSELCDVCEVETMPSNNDVPIVAQTLSAAGLDEKQNVAGPEKGVGDSSRPPKSKTPFLDKFGRDLTALARAGELSPCIGRKDETRSVAQILRRQSKNNPVLIGDPGVGKTCIVEGLANRIVDPKSNKAIQDWRIVELSMANLIAGCMFQGQFEDRLQTLVKEAQSDDNLILFLDELHTLVGAGGGHGKGLDAGQILKPALARGELRLIGATTTAEYRKHIEQDAALERRFQTVWVEEPDRSDAIAIVRGLRPRLEEHHGMVIEDKVIEKAVDWSLRYLPDHRLPDKALDLIDQACAAFVLETLSMGEESETTSIRISSGSLTEEKLAQVVAERCRVPVGLVGSEEAERLLHIEDELLKRVYGQDEAIQEVGDAIRTARAGLKGSDRPQGVFLFLGPTGTGKTELAKGLSNCLFGNEQSLIRIDMSEYGEKHNVARLIGAPPGYIGHDEEGQLTGKVRTKPYSVILFDEIEKAHEDVFDLFLQIFDDGSLTDSKGRRVSFSETIIIMTSNLGAGSNGPKANRPAGFQVGSAQGPAEDNGNRADGSIEAVKDTFKPEFINRIDRQIVFKSLSFDVVERILDKLVDELNGRLSDKEIFVSLSDESRKRILTEGHNTEFGARELERVFERRISTPLARELIEDNIGVGDRVEVRLEDGEFLFLRK